MNDGFEWDEAKAADNFAKHGVSFETACAVFKDAFAIEALDDPKHMARTVSLSSAWCKAFFCLWPTPHASTAFA